MYRIITDHPVALASRDHTHPSGTANDNSVNPRFNRRLYELLPRRPLRVLDLGCAGGGFTKSVLDDGHEAVGVEGSDYSLKRKRAEWATIPDSLFTADITRRFQLTKAWPDGTELNARFDAVTAWEVMEHIPEAGLPQLCENVRRHLGTGGLWFMSVSRQVGFHHVTVRDRPWWLALFARNGLADRPDVVEKFAPEDWVRGPLQNAPDSFHLVLGVG
jgi:cyclopropane fatty-acyl-phospholipid synthase-like methyltransferase